ncbi:hypothetical protein JW905_09755, partial [bacterium]|nr:hypothetical protein [candidate division CSSED10-310 bacterium]
PGMSVGNPTALRLATPVPTPVEQYQINPIGKEQPEYSQPVRITLEDHRPVPLDGSYYFRDPEQRFPHLQYAGQTETVGYYKQKTRL